MTPLIVFAEGSIRDTALEEGHIAGRASVRLARIDCHRSDGLHRGALLVYLGSTVTLRPGTSS